MITHSILDSFDYQYPPQLIAQEPTHPRDSARLLAYSLQTQTITHRHFTDLPQHIPSNAVLVFNQTKVMPARFTVYKPSGGKANLLYLGNDNAKTSPHFPINHWLSEVLYG